MFNSIKAVIFYVEDIEKSKDFYANILGFSINQDQGDFVSFKVDKSDNVSLAINLASNEDKVPGRQTVLLGVDNIEKVYKFIQDKDIDIITELSQFEWGKTFAFVDIDGNKLEVVE
jgi:predicted enzyme related to lactoylglutathione lyase